MFDSLKSNVEMLHIFCKWYNFDSVLLEDMKYIMKQ